MYNHQIQCSKEGSRVEITQGQNKADHMGHHGSEINSSMLSKY